METKLPVHQRLCDVNPALNHEHVAQYMRQEERAHDQEVYDRLVIPYRVPRTEEQGPRSSFAPDLWFDPAPDWVPKLTKVLLHWGNLEETVATALAWCAAAPMRGDSAAMLLGSTNFYDPNKYVRVVEWLRANGCPL